VVHSSRLKIQLVSNLVQVVPDSPDLSEGTFPLTAVLAVGHFDGQSALDQEARKGELSGLRSSRDALMLVNSGARQDLLRVVNLVNLSDGVTSRRSASKPDMNLSIHPAPR
jgi:hypothetical protein